MSVSMAEDHHILQCAQHKATNVYGSVMALRI